MSRLTDAQRRVLAKIATRPCGNYTPWVLGTATCEALRKRGLVTAVHKREGEDHPFTGRFGHDPTIEITPAGRAALKDATRGRGE